MNIISNSIQTDLKNLINIEYNKIEKEFNQPNTRIHHTNIYHKDWSNNGCKEILDILKNTYNINTDNIISLGFISGQQNCIDQHFHVDYNGVTETYFIPLCNLTNNNGTEYLEFNDPIINIDLFEFIKKISDKYNSKEQIIQQLRSVDIPDNIYSFKIANCPAYSLIHLPNYVLHRGRKNNENYNKIMFQIVLAAISNANISSKINFYDSELDEDPEIIDILIKSRSLNEKSV